MGKKISRALCEAQIGNHGHGIYIPLTLPLKECIQVRTKLSEGQLFTFRDRQDSCLPSAARLDIADDQGKGKVGPRKVLFVQENSFLSQYTLAGYIFLLCRGLSTTRPEIGK